MSAEQSNPTRRMQIAIQIADAAACMDHLKNLPTPAERTEAAEHVKKLHNIAAELAGSRVLEIYGPDIEEELHAPL